MKKCIISVITVAAIILLQIIILIKIPAIPILPPRDFRVEECNDEAYATRRNIFGKDVYIHPKKAENKFLEDYDFIINRMEQLFYIEYSDDYNSRRLFEIYGWQTYFDSATEEHSEELSIKSQYVTMHEYTILNGKWRRYIEESEPKDWLIFFLVIIVVILINISILRKVIRFVFKYF